MCCIAINTASEVCELGRAASLRNHEPRISTNLSNSPVSQVLKVRSSRVQVIWMWRRYPPLSFANSDVYNALSLVQKKKSPWKNIINRPPLYHHFLQQVLQNTSTTHDETFHSPSLRNNKSLSDIIYTKTDLKLFCPRWTPPRLESRTSTWRSSTTRTRRSCDSFLPMSSSGRRFRLVCAALFCYLYPWFRASIWNIYLSHFP